MRKCFWDDPYQTKHQTTVVQTHENEVLLAETIIFSFSGGQESDKGTIHGLPVLDSRIEGTNIYYGLPQDHGLQEGQDVEIAIDWNRRLKLMRLHFAAELILELVTRELGVLKIGAHIAESKARIDFSCQNNISSVFEAVLEQYHQIIIDDKVIHKGYLDEQAQRRYWEIEGFSKVPCGGTHVKSTREVGHVRLKRVNIGKGKERIEIKLLEP